MRNIPLVRMFCHSLHHISGHIPWHHCCTLLYFKHPFTINCLWPFGNKWKKAADSDYSSLIEKNMGTCETTMLTVQSFFHCFWSNDMTVFDMINMIFGGICIFFYSIPNRRMPVSFWLLMFQFFIIFWLNFFCFWFVFSMISLQYPLLSCWLCLCGQKLFLH